MSIDGKIMATFSERVPVLMSREQKAQVVKKAKKAGFSVGEYMRKAAASFNPSQDDKLLEGMIEQMLKDTDRAEKAIDEALDFVATSNKRIADMELQRK